MLELGQKMPLNTAKNRILRLEDSSILPSTTKRQANKESMSKFFLMDCFMNSRSKSNMNNDSSLNHKGNSLEIKLKNTTMLGRQGRKSKSPKAADANQMMGNKST